MQKVQNLKKKGSIKTIVDFNENQFPDMSQGRKESI